MPNGRPVQVLADIGVSATMVALSLVQKIRLSVQRLDIDASGAGGLLNQCLVEGTPSASARRRFHF
jgi:hypothetical protein